MTKTDQIETIQAKALIGEYGTKAVEVAKRRVNNILKNQHSKESDLHYRVLNEVEKLLENQK